MKGIRKVTIDKHCAILRYLKERDGQVNNYSEIAKTFKVDGGLKGTLLRADLIKVDADNRTHCQFVEAQPIMARKALEANRKYVKIVSAGLKAKKVAVKKADCYIYLTTYSVDGQSCEYATIGNDANHKIIHDQAEAAITKRIDTSVQWPTGYRVETILSTVKGKEVKR